MVVEKRIPDEREAFAKRLEQALRHGGYPFDRSIRGRIAGWFGVSRESARKWLAGESMPETKRIRELATRCGVHGEWLLTGEGPMEAHDGANSASGTGRIVEDSAATYSTYGRRRSIPVIDYVQAGTPREVIDAYSAGDGFRTVTLEGVIADEVGPYTFALEVSGDSMAPDFVEGDTVVIDPDEAPRPGEIVVAKLERDEAATLKKYRERGYDASNLPIIELKPLNEDYAPITLNADNPGVIIGPVVEHRRRMRR